MSVVINNYNQPITLTKEQQACVDYKGTRALDLKIQGIAGAGKSIVLLVRAIKSLKSNPDDSYAFFTYNNTLAKMVKEEMKRNGVPDGRICVCTLNSYLNKVYQQIAGHTYGNAIYPQARSKFMEQAIENHLKKTGIRTRLHDIDVNYWLDEVQWMKDRNIGLLDLQRYLDIKRTGRGRDVHITNQDKKLVFQFYKEYAAVLERKKVFEWEDRYLYVAHNSSRIPESMKFDHIYIDEAQDQSLTKMIGLMSLKASTGKSDITIAMDMNQQIYGKQMMIPGLQSTTKKLTKTFRCSIEIDALAESLRVHNDQYMNEEDKNPHIIPTRNGPMPIIHECADVAEEKKYVLEVIKGWLKEEKYLVIGVLSTTNAQNDMYSEWLTDAGIKHEKITKNDEFSVREPGVKVATIFSVKGMEFTHVIIPQFQEGKLPRIHEKKDQELILEEIIKNRSMAYVAMTRAMNGLVITYSGKPSRFIEEMDKNLYKFSCTRPVEEIKKSETKNVSVRKKSSPELTRIGRTGSPKDLLENREEKQQDTAHDLKEYFESKGIEVVDKRAQGGCLWLVGEREDLKPYVSEARKLYGAYGSYGSGRATKHREGWFTKCQK